MLTQPRRMAAGMFGPTDPLVQPTIYVGSDETNPSDVASPWMFRICLQNHLPDLTLHHALARTIVRNNRFGIWMTDESADSTHGIHPSWYR